MKKFLSFVLLGLLATPAFAGKWQYGSLMNGSALVLSNNATVLFNSTNVMYVLPNNIATWSFTLTNLVPSTGQSGTNYVPQAFYYTNLQAFTSTNAPIGGYNTNGGGYLSDGVFGAYQSEPDGYGAPTANSLLSVVVQGPPYAIDAIAGPPTNTITVELFKGVGPDGTNYATDGVLNYDRFVVAFSGVTVTNAIITTNLPTTFTTGARRIRVGRVASSNVSSGTNTIIKDISITAWVP